MAYTVETLETAREELAALPKKHQRQIAAKIDTLANHPRPPGAKLIDKDDNLWRIRSGDYRVIYSIQDKKVTVLVVRIGNRKEVYRSLEALSRHIEIWQDSQTER